MTTSLAANHLTAMTSSNTLRRIASADAQLSVIETIEDEMLEVYKELRGKWSKGNLAKLIHLDSPIRKYAFG